MASFPEHSANEPGRPYGRSDEAKAGAVAAGATVLAICGAAAIVLAILGLLEMWPLWMTTLATLAIGVGLIVHGLGIMARNARLISQSGGTVESAEAAAGVSPEFFAGCAGVVLGILALLNIYPEVLSAAALIAFGGALLFASTPRAHAGHVTTTDVGREEAVGRSFLSRSTGAHMMAGLGVIALGVLSLIGFAPLALILVGLLVTGAVLLLTGAAVAGFMSALLARERRRTSRI